MEELRLNNYMDDVEKLELQKLYHEKYFGSILPAIAEQYSQGQIDLAKNTLNCIADGEDDYSYANVFGEDGKISSFYDQDSRNVKEWMDNNRTEIEGTFSKISNKQDGPYAKNLEAFKNMIQGEGDNGMVPIWKSGIGDILTEITKEDGFQKTVLDAYGKIDQATKDYQQDLTGVGIAAGVELPKVGQQLDPDIEKTQGLKDANKDLLQSYKDIFNAITGPGGW